MLFNCTLTKSGLLSIGIMKSLQLIAYRLIIFPNSLSVSRLVSTHYRVHLPEPMKRLFWFSIRVNLKNMRALS